MSRSSAEPRIHSDALVIGGGPAGLAAALTLARFDRTVTLVDSGHGRSTYRQINHNYLGFPGGISPVRLRELGLKQLTEYPKVDVAAGLVQRLGFAAGGGFQAERADGSTVTARVVILATGVIDHYPQFDGWQECVGVSMFWCITCDGYENRGRDVIVVGHDDAAAGEAIQLRALTDRVRLLTNSDTDVFSEAARERLEKLDIPVLHDRIAGAVSEDGQLRAIVTAAGETLTLESLFSVQGATPRSELAVPLGVPVDEKGWILVDTEQKTAVEGCYAAGDVTALHSHQVSVAAHEGTQAACAANYYLYPPELKLP